MPEWTRVRRASPAPVRRCTWRSASRTPAWCPTRRFARELSDTSLMFLVHPTLEDGHIDQTRHALEAVMAEATAPGAARASG